VPRATKDARLDTAAARARLVVRKKPHYRLIEPGLHVGYYRGTTGGTWVARRYLGTRYETQRLGLADDGRAADGRVVLTFSQAQTKAREWATSQERQAAGVADATPWTVADAVSHYLADYTARGGKALGYLDTTFKAHVLSKLGDKLIGEITPSIIRAWHRGLATSPARLRTRANSKVQRTRTVPAADVDANRARRATANGILTLFKAALNYAYREGKVTNDDAWRRIQPFQKVQSPRIRYLTDEETVRLVNACNSDFRELVIGALLTGCRYQELATLRPADIDLDASVLLIRAAKGGGSRHAVLTDEAKRFFAQRVAGKGQTALLFERHEIVRARSKNAEAETRRAPWGKSHQFRPLRTACEAAKIVPPISFHILRHTHASRLAMKGVPMHVIAAQLGHSSIKVTERHYAHLSPGYISDTIRAAFGDLGLVPETNVTAMQRREAAQ
jgi:integrase